MNDTLREIKERDHTITRLQNICALLEWDQETCMPEKAAEERARQIALISGIIHEEITNSRWRELFAELGADEHSPPHSPKLSAQDAAKLSAQDAAKLSAQDAAKLSAQDAAKLSAQDAALLREVHRRWKRDSRLSEKLVVEMAEQASLGQSAWIKARENNDFPAFAPHLERLIELQRQYARSIETKPDTEIYNVLLDDYERDANANSIADIFDGLTEGLKKLIHTLKKGEEPPTHFLNQNFPIEKQEILGKMVQASIGYDTHRGRNDLSTHPFCTTIGPHDIRVTTRYRDQQLFSGLLGNVHEAGHAIYEQGIPEELHMSILGQGASMGIHESQSLFWENMIGRSRTFWTHWFDKLCQIFPGHFNEITPENLFRAANIVRPDFIRVEADEVTYCLHVIIRFQLERRLISGNLPVSRLPAEWKESYQEYLGISPPNDTLGCLQDVHWSGGAFGYFPSYALGKLYAAQFTAAMEKDIGSLSERTAQGQNDEILQWLRNNIHCHGSIHPPMELCRHVSGENLNSHHFLDYLERKYRDIYRI